MLVDAPAEAHEPQRRSSPLLLVCHGLETLPAPQRPADGPRASRPRRARAGGALPARPASRTLPSYSLPPGTYELVDSVEALARVHAAVLGPPGAPTPAAAQGSEAPTDAALRGAFAAEHVYPAADGWACGPGAVPGQPAAAEQAGLATEGLAARGEPAAPGEPAGSAGGSVLAIEAEQGLVPGSPGAVPGAATGSTAESSGAAAPAALAVAGKTAASVIAVAGSCSAAPDGALGAGSAVRPAATPPRGFGPVNSAWRGTPDLAWGAAAACASPSSATADGAGAGDGAGATWGAHPPVVGIDAEWAPGTRGAAPGPVSLLQIATRRRVYLLDLLRLCGDGGGGGDVSCDGGGETGSDAPCDGGGETGGSLPGSPLRSQGAAGGGAAGAGRGAAERAAALSDFLGALLGAQHIVMAGFGLRYDLRRLAESYPRLPCFGGGGGGALPARVAGHVDVLRLARAASPPAQQARPRSECA